MHSPSSRSDGHGGRVEPQRAGELVRNGNEIVAERRNDRPDPLPARERAVDDHAGANAGRGVDVKGRGRMRRQLPRIVMVVVVDTHAAVEEREQRGAIRIDGDVERRHRVPTLRRNALEQRNVALDAGHERGLARRIEAQLEQRADAVSIAVERIEMAHAMPDPNRVVLMICEDAR